MSTIDLSRLATDPRKHYAGVRMQQGRVLTDDDFNEAAALDAEDMRRTRLHAIGACGAPDAGFVPKDFAVVAGKLDFKLSAGTLYLGGLRLDMNADEPYLLQKDWLNFDPATEAQVPPDEGEMRTDLVWIEGWQQPVTAVEDSELFEVALGGPDTSTRWRTMRRIHVAPGVEESECANAWATVSADFAALGAIGADMELATTATLSVSFSVPPERGDLCSPPQSGGYLGAENQAIRLQMVDDSHYTWGFDNGGPLYRVQVGPQDGRLVKLTLLNLPKDAQHWPLKDQVVEILPWSAALANGERIAELQGHLCKVKVSYDPDDHSLEIDVPVPAAFAQWQARADKAEFFDGSPAQDFLYLRLWNRGDDLASAAAIPITSAELGHTGLRVSFAGAPLRPGDHWIIAARPASPDALVPWRLGLPTGAAPHGIRRYRAPIALVEWKTQAGVTSGRVLHDCRPAFLPLTRIRGCCSVTVGDGSHSSGMFTSIQAALESLPAGGGTVCILPGRYEESVRLIGRRNVTLHGCGPSSRIVASERSSTALLIIGGRDIVVESLSFEGGPDAVIELRLSEAVRIASCLVQVRDRRELFSSWPAVFVAGRAVELEDNIIEPLPNELGRVFQKTAAGRRAQQALSARGGIQLGGGCEQVRIAGNVIAGGTGNGITLGSILRIPEQQSRGEELPDIDIDDPCAPCDPVDSGAEPEGDDGRVRYESAGDLYEIEIDNNLIVRQGANGISVVRFFRPSVKDSTLVLVTVRGLRIACNHIVACLRRAVAPAPLDSRFLLGYGGISLAFVTALEIESNLIAGNGRNWLSPVCGVFVLAAEGLRIEHNRIRANGARNEEPVDSAQSGIRAGVHVWMAIGEQSAAVDRKPAAFSSLRSIRGASQLRIHGNQIWQPLGRALCMLGAGPMAITDNLLASEGGGHATDPVASTVLVTNAGFSREWTRGLLYTLLYLVYAASKPESNNVKLLQQVCAMAQRSAAMPGLWPRLPTGKLMFNDNQVSFQMRDAARGLDLASALLVSLDDVAACDNQFEYHTQQRRVLADVVALGLTVRTSDNRLAETWGRATRSLLSAALLNTAADNQSTHCISAAGVRRAVHDNLVLAQAFCVTACDDQARVIARAARAARAAGPQQ